MSLSLHLQRKFRGERWTNAATIVSLYQTTFYSLSLWTFQTVPPASSPPSPPHLSHCPRPGESGDLHQWGVHPCRLQQFPPRYGFSGRLWGVVWEREYLHTGIRHLHHPRTHQQ